MNILFRYYIKFHKWVIKDLDTLSSNDKKDTHKLMASVLFTSVIMWAYVITIYFYSDSMMLLLTAFITSLIHSLSVFLFRFGFKIDLIVHVYIVQAFILNLVFTHSTGGLFSSTIVWPSVLPVVAGIIRGRRALYTWFLLSLFSVSYFLYLGDTQYNLISETGRYIVSFNIAFGYLLLNAALIIIYIRSKEIADLVLEKRNQAIHRLLRIVSHDIANPLTAMHFRLTVLKSKIEKYSEEEKKLFKDIEESANMMYMILEQTRRYESAVTNPSQDTSLRVNLNDVIKNAQFTFKEMLYNKSITINYDFDKNKMVSFKGVDIEVKNQIFNNLFSNSIKFMRDYGEISIKVIDDKNTVTIIYKDTGEGIDPKIIKNIFRADVKTSKVGLEGELGSGFGMPILSQTLKSFGGSVTVSSILRSDNPKECGSTFTLTFQK